MRNRAFVEVLLSFFKSSSPLIPGSFASIIIKSGCSSRISFRASSPFPLWPTTK